MKTTTFLMMMLAFSLAFAMPVSADQNPIGCDTNGLSLLLTVFRNDGMTSISGADTVQSGETIKYSATLQHAGGTSCNFEGGTLIVTTPDGNPHDVTPMGGIPLVSSGMPFVSAMVPYVVSEADASGSTLSADADYTGGESHTGNVHDPASASIGKNTQFLDVSLEVTKTADPALEETFEWSIDKSVTPGTWELFTGDSGTSEYTVTVTKTQGESSHSVTGTISIHNPADFATASVTDVSDVIDGIGAVTVDCPDGLSFDVGPGETVECTYSSDLPDGTTRTNTATVTTSGDVDGDSGQADIDFSGVIPETTNDEVNVEDTNGMSWLTNHSDTFVYTNVFSCDDDEGQHDNTATIVETEQFDTASVTVNCYGLDVVKDATTAFDRTYEWSIDKTADQTELVLSLGQQFQVNYEVTADVAGNVDSNWGVSGQIFVLNSAPIDAVINDVADVVSPDIAATVDCGVVFPYTIVSGGNLTCSYDTSLPDGLNRTNTGTATLQNYDYPAMGDPSEAGTTDFSGEADVMFGNSPANEFDTCVNVTDSMNGFLGTTCVGGAPETFGYSIFVGPFNESECGNFTIDNVADFATNDNQATGNDTWSVLVQINCPAGCTLTQGYWKTHNDEFHGGAPTDDNWENIGPLKELEVFFPNTTAPQNTATWYDVFWTAPKGNAYYNLAHQYEAAVLNTLNGATTTPEVDSALADATALFDEYTPNEAANLLKGKNKKGNEALHQEFITLAGILGSYNEGDIGPGHCSEDGTSNDSFAGTNGKN